MSSARFDPQAWLARWSKVGSVVTGAHGPALMLDLDGNAAEQRMLLGRLDGKRGRREAVRDAVETPRG